MKIIKIFLASSIVEFKKERYELKAFINSLNDICVRHDIYLEMKICEELSNAVAMERKQNEYNELIRNSDYLFMLFGKDAGQYTIEEFDVALDHFQTNGAPKIHIYFKRLPVGEIAEKSIFDFKERLNKELGYSYSEFVDLDTIKLNLMSELVQDGLLNSNIEFRNGQPVLPIP